MQPPQDGKEGQQQQQMGYAPYGFYPGYYPPQGSMPANGMAPQMMMMAPMGQSQQQETSGAAMSIDQP